MALLIWLNKNIVLFGDSDFLLQKEVVIYDDALCEECGIIVS
ncbi:MAG: hypothetical protein SOW56_01960 [Bacteroidaceae bacterium]|nr:hypothetical protein [Bacteroidaceae bacterium]